MWSGGEFQAVIDAPPVLINDGVLGEVRVQSKMRVWSGRAISEGAVRLLYSGSLAPDNAATSAAVQELFPARIAVREFQDCLGPPLECPREELMAGLRSFKAGRAYRRDGLHLRQLLDSLGPPSHGTTSLLVESLTSFLSGSLQGRDPRGD